LIHFYKSRQGENMVKYLLFFFASLYFGSEVLGQESKTCYDCGYMCKNLQAGECVPEPITEDGSIHFCKDTATMGSMTKQCTGSDECCGSLVEFLEIKNEATGELTINKITYHGCEKDLAPALGAHVEVVCGEHTNACYNVSSEDIHEDFVQRAEACFCEGNLCNNNTPDLPEPEPAPGGHKCYNCGYKCTNMVGNVCKPEPLGDDAPFCGDVATMGSMTKECAGAETECCGSLKEFFEVKDEQSGETRMDMFAFHGCEGDLEHALSVQVEVLCSGHESTCYNVSRDTIGDTEIIRAEACFCDGDLCNNNLPDLPAPGPTDAAPTEPGPSKTCYNCGYKCSDMHSGTCTPEPIDAEGKVPFCGDSASMGSSTKQCGGTDECCGVLREYFELVVDGKDRTDMLTFHGCEKDLAGALNSHVEVICSDHANSCFNVSMDNIQEDFLTEAEACFCEGDLCNKDLPDLPFPPPLPTEKPTDAPPAPCPECTKCYNCGYKQDGLDGEMGEIMGVAFCNDFATENTVVSCGMDDCCGMLKEYFIKVDADGNNSTEIIGRHGCAADIDHLGHYSATCEKNGDSCWEVEDDSLDHDHDDGHTIFRAEICLCGQDRCNNADPVPEIPTTTAAPGSSASHVASALLTLIISLGLQI